MLHNVRKSLNCLTFVKDQQPDNFSGAWKSPSPKMGRPLKLKRNHQGQWDIAGWDENDWHCCCLSKELPRKARLCSIYQQRSSSSSVPFMCFYEKTLGERESELKSKAKKDRASPRCSKISLKAKLERQQDRCISTLQCSILILPTTSNLFYEAFFRSQSTDLDGLNQPFTSWNGNILSLMYYGILVVGSPGWASNLFQPLFYRSPGR